MKRKPSITALYPGTADVAAAQAWSVEVVRSVADVPGCPLVRGGKGRRFVSIEAFTAWFGKLPIEQQLLVPEVDKAQRKKLAEEIAKLAWLGEDGAIRLAHVHDYHELAAMRDRWRDHDQAEKGEDAARRALRSVDGSAGVRRGPDGLPSKLRLS